MLDPLPPSPKWLRDAVEPWAVYLNIPAVTDHVHEIIAAFAFYQFIHSCLSPWLSPILFPRHYPKLNRRTKLNWDVHVVSLVQSVLINAVGLWVLFVDEERKSMTTAERIYGYTGGCALVAALATGYFIYDLYISTVYLKMFGVGMLFHAVSALWVFSFGFRPFVNYYSPVFILYELSSPFLNMHWFLDKVNMTGSKFQLYNGILLLAVFFSCRLIWGTWQSVLVYQDMWYALKQSWSASTSPALNPVDITADVFQIRDGSLCVNQACARAQAEISKFSRYTAGGVPTWLVVTYVVSNLVLNTLNFYWFTKMIDAVLKRFRKPAAKKEDAQTVVIEAAGKLEQEEGAFTTGDLAGEPIASAVDAGLTDELRKRKADPTIVARS
ncbi:TLC domain-containing protein [Aspergillus clavatus NRRL 1]|uniref:DUF887 domain protein n=1 Tax=Aspergillus clavatus (strain ATCC 1007 / CBS 513.65 / DSM 816 / NCTC 3887 / NRRL 1 / QM 1276 / 107) TaxID=344612 RepID=A1CR42_ASPCL|nr:DUF887 domain protein [Aspergillus clavatus NRRL 1]EAW08113.1 DUF887 domain protein [Aspergillus clavatus NRRL 1]